MSLPSVSAKTPLVFHPEDTQLYSLNFTQFGIGNRTIATVNSIAADQPGLVFGDLAPSTVETAGEKDQAVAVGKAALFSMSGGMAGQDYECVCNVTYSDGSIVNGVFLAQCRDA